LSFATASNNRLCGSGSSDMLMGSESDECVAGCHSTKGAQFTGPTTEPGDHAVGWRGDG
jgi:hypothetical protein